MQTGSTSPLLGNYTKLPQHGDDSEDDDPLTSLPTRNNPTQQRGPNVQYNTYQTDDIQSITQDQSDVQSGGGKKKGKKNKDKKDKENNNNNNLPLSNDNGNNNSNINSNIITNTTSTLPTTEFTTKSFSKYDMKNHMANERTFFKYLFTGLHIGSIGTLVLTFFPSGDALKLYLVMFIWIIAFAFMFWGLYGYYRRKKLMEMGKFNEGAEISPHTPLIISAIFVFVIILIVFYGLIVHSSGEDGKSLSLSQLFMMDEGKKQNNNGKGRRRRNRNRNNNNKGKEDIANDETNTKPAGVSVTPDIRDIHNNNKNNNNNNNNLDNQQHPTQITNAAGFVDPVRTDKIQFKTNEEVKLEDKAIKQQIVKNNNKTNKNKRLVNDYDDDNEDSETYTHDIDTVDDESTAGH